jgi:DNA-binding beta-propeller fold protein YncE
MRQRVLVIIGLALLLAACEYIAAPAEPSSPPSPSPTARVTPAQTEPHTPLPTAGATPSVVPQPTSTLEQIATPAPSAYTLIVTDSTGHDICFIDPQSGKVTQIEVGTAPWGLALAPNDMAYVATAEGVAVVDIRRRERVALIVYQAKIGQPTFGEYRPGGMGIAVAPDGARVYVGVFLPDRSGRLEVIAAGKRAVIASVPIGVRPFQVIASPDGRTVYTIDHDTFTVTVIDTTTYATRTLPVEPLGNTGWGSWDKPHYAALRADGHLLLPIQGRVLVDLDPISGKSVALPLKANTHQHGVALTPDGRRLLIVGTGPAGDAQGPPRLTVLDLATMAEDDIPLSRPHEQVALSPDGRMAYVTGGHTFGNAGWDGISVVNLDQRSVTELVVPDRPLGIQILP